MIINVDTMNEMGFPSHWDEMVAIRENASFISSSCCAEQVRPLSLHRFGI
jgi:hypothetical protein